MFFQGRGKGAGSISNLILFLPLLHPFIPGSNYLTVLPAVSNVKEILVPSAAMTVCKK